MLEHVRVVPLAAESFGVRSMCTLVETPDIRVLLDAGVSLCPKRFGLPPHPAEFRAIDDARRKIAEVASRADIITISHYHNDHHTPSFEDWLCNWTRFGETARQIYEGKVVLVKNPRVCINYSQRQRGWMFQQTAGKWAERVEVADGKTFTFGETAVRFSEPVFHGPESSELGWVLMVTIHFRDEKLLFAPDVQGPISMHTLAMIVNEKPQLLMIGGPPLYLAVFKVREDQIRRVLENLEEIAEKVPHVILEHHILRDEQWREKIVNVFYSAHKSEHSVQTAAEFLGRPNCFLEAARKRLFIEDPPRKEFEAWMHASDETKRRVKPPI